MPRVRFSFALAKHLTETRVQLKPSASHRKQRTEGRSNRNKKRRTLELDRWRFEEGNDKHRWPAAAVGSGWLFGGRALRRWRASFLADFCACKCPLLSRLELVSVIYFHGVAGDSNRRVSRLAFSSPRVRADESARRGKRRGLMPEVVSADCSAIYCPLLSCGARRGVPNFVTGSTAEQAYSSMD
jgi:hypothetical protein